MEKKIIDRKKDDLQPVIYVSWEESERGWGTRPDGCSLHLTNEDFRKFEKAYWEKMPNEAPYEYSRPVGRPVTVYVYRDLYDIIGDKEYGIRLREHEERGLVKEKYLVYGSERSGWVSMNSNDCENHEREKTKNNERKCS